MNKKSLMQTVIRVRDTQRVLGFAWGVFWEALGERCLAVKEQCHAEEYQILSVKFKNEREPSKLPAWELLVLIWGRSSSERKVLSALRIACGSPGGLLLRGRPV